MGLCGERVAADVVRLLHDGSVTVDDQTCVGRRGHEHGHRAPGFRTRTRKRVIGREHLGCRDAR